MTYLCPQMMSVKARHRAFVAWLLLMTFMPLMVVKIVHHHGSDGSAPCQKAPSGSPTAAGDCFICHFLLSPFTEAQDVTLTVFLTVCTLVAASLCAGCPIVSRRTARLRAPPLV